MNKVLNILIPGSFKPVHSGHIRMIRNYLSYPSYDVNVYVYVSDKSRDGLKSGTTIDFLNKVFSGYKNFKTVPCQGSPINAVYNSTSMKDYGDGIYVMGSSNKDYDRKRTDDYIKNFSIGGKYYTSGVEMLDVPCEEQTLLFTRDDDYDATPISSRVVRNDIKRGDYNSFLSAYPDSPVPDEDIREYYDKLRTEIGDFVNESGAAGHISNFQEVSGLKFGEIRKMISDLLGSEVKDISEKIDGMNIFASVDLQGRVIFARNKSNLWTKPLYKEDLIKGKNWTEDRKKRVIEAAECISKVFAEIKSVVDLFNYDDRLDGITYRTWCNFEIVGQGCENIIPYAANYVSYHGCATACDDHNKGSKEKETFEPIDEEKIEAIVKTAISDASKKGVNVKCTPKIILNQSLDLNSLKDKWINELDDLMDEYSLNDENTIFDYKKNAYKRYLLPNSYRLFGTVYSSFGELLASRLAGDKIPLSSFRKTDREKIKEFEKRKSLLKTIIKPLDQFFMEFGNDVIKACSGLINSGQEDEVIKEMKRKIANAIKNVNDSGNVKDMDRLEYLLVRLGDSTALNATEGIVFRYGGKLCKLTGSFAVVNQIVNLNKRSQ